MIRRLRESVPRTTLALICLSAVVVLPPARAQEQKTPEEAPEQPAPEGAAEPAALDDVAPEERDPQRGDEVVARFEDGRRMRGKFISDDGITLFMEVAGVELEIPRSKVSDLVVLDPPLVRYERMRRMVGDNPDQIVNLAEWCRRQGLYAQGLAQVERALDLDPHHGDALRLKTLIERQYALHKSRKDDAGSPERDEAEPRERPRFERRLPPSEFPLLNEEQINLMNVYEVDLNDPPRMVIPRDTVEELIRRYSSHPLVPATREGRREVLRMSETEILDLMFRLRARELYSQVEVLESPRSLKLFREKINSGWLVNQMATTRCHGGRDAGRLLLTNRKPGSNEAAYTNLLILERFTLDTGEPLINYDQPELSPLLQMGLPRDDTAFPHPEVYGWRPVFRSRDDRAFRLTVEWIESMYRPRPDYPIEYEPPVSESAGEPDQEFPDRGVER